MRRSPTQPAHHRAIHVVLCLAVLFGMSLAAWHQSAASEVRPECVGAIGAHGAPTVSSTHHAHDSSRCILCIAAAHSPAVGGPVNTGPPFSKNSAPPQIAEQSFDGECSVGPSLPRAPPHA